MLKILEAPVSPGLEPSYLFIHVSSEGDLFLLSSVQRRLMHTRVLSSFDALLPTGCGKYIFLFQSTFVL